MPRYAIVEAFLFVITREKKLQYRGSRQNPLGKLTNGKEKS